MKNTMNKTEWWEAVLIDDKTGEVIDYTAGSTGELQIFLARWNDEELCLIRASICFSQVK